MADPGGERCIHLTGTGARRVLLLIFLAGIAAVFLVPAGDVSASPDPPPNGNWTIGAGENVVKSQDVLDLHGNLEVRGTLRMDNCTLWVHLDIGGPRSITVHPGGELRLYDTQVSGVGVGDQYVVLAERGSTLVLDGSSFFRAGHALTSDGRQSGVYVATDAVLRNVEFIQCLVGLWVVDADVLLQDCSFFLCSFGVVVNDGGVLVAERGSFQLCQTGGLCNASTLTVRDSLVDGCQDGLLAYGGVLTIENVTAMANIVGVGSYGAVLLASDCLVKEADSTGIVIHTSKAWVDDCVFEDLYTDVKAIHSEVWIKGTSHRDSYDEALYMYHSVFHIDGVQTRDSYWGLRAYKSTGECTNLTTINATYGAYMEACVDFLLKDLDIDGGKRVDQPNARGIYVTRGSFRMRDIRISNVRTGVDLLTTSGTAVNISIANCSHQGVLAGQCWDYVLRDVTVSNAYVGFWLNLFSGGRLEGCVATKCRGIGFNFTSRVTTTLFECNSSYNPTGLFVYYSSPTIIDTDVWMCDEWGDPVNTTLGLDALASSPRIRGGTYTGGYGGMRLNRTSAVVRDVTFIDSDRWCIQSREASTDLIEGCTFRPLVNATGIVVWKGSPTIRTSTFYQVNYGIMGADFSTLVIEDNVIINVTYNGLWLVHNSSATMSGNIIRDVGFYALHVMWYSHLTCRNDVITDSVRYGALVWKASTVDMYGCSIINCSVGIYAFDATEVRVAYTEMRDLNRGVVIYKDFGSNALAPYVKGRVEGCYFSNHSSYAVGVFDGTLTVLDSNFLDNIGAIWVKNTTATITDTTMVGSWLFGLRAEGTSRVQWEVTGRCRVISSDIKGRVDFRVRDSGDLLIEDSQVDMEALGSFTATGTSKVTVRGCQWEADGSRFYMEGGKATLVNTNFVAVGPPLGSDQRRIGVSLHNCEATVSGCSFSRTRTGLNLWDSVVEVTASMFKECGDYAIHCHGTDLVLEDTRINRTMKGTSVHLEGSTLEAVRSTITITVNGLWMNGSVAEMTNCSISGASSSAIMVYHSTLDLFNVTHQSDRLEVGEGGVVRVSWYLTVRLLWPEPSDLVNAEVRVDDQRGIEVWRVNPDPGGIVRDRLVLTLLHQLNGTVQHGPHTVHADLRGYRVSRVLDISSSTTVILDLKDTDPPVIQVLSPTEAEVWSKQGMMEFVGVAVDAGSGTAAVTLWLDYAPTPFSTDGDVFAFTVTLADGRHVVELVATDRAGNEAKWTLVVNILTQPIVLSPPEPSDGTVTNLKVLTFHGRLSRTEGVKVRINRALAVLDFDNRSYHLEMAIHEGVNHLTILAEDHYGHQTWANISIEADWTPPALVISSPLEVNTTEEWVELTGRVDADARLFIQGTLVLLREGDFSVRYPIYVGETTIILKAEDDVGNTEQVDVYVFRYEVYVEPEGPNPWEVYIFFIIIPLLMVAVYIVLRRIELGGDAE